MPELDGTGRHLDPTELRAWTGFLDAGRMLEEVLGRHLVLDHELTHREYEILVRLDGHGGRMRLSVLAKDIVASPALVSQTIDRLSARGLVERDRNPEMARGVDAVLLAPGRAALAGASGEHALIIRSLLIDRIGPERVATVADAMQEVADHLRAHRRGRVCDDDDCAVLHYS